MKDLSRRQILKTIAASGGMLGLAPIAKAALECGPSTVRQTEGPFYPVRDQIDKDTDLTKVAGSSKAALGRQIVVEGIVQDEKCAPVKDAFVEIWQACASGKYNHPADPNLAPMDPNFQYWGIARTNAKGEYSFKTIYPGAYPADENWMRPPHIHFKVHKWGYRELITQLYFEGEAFNELDLILQALSEPDQVSVVRPVENEIVKFPITLHKVK
jgi:protocatechuate 3,4-dioxygenase beta subunit